MATQACDDEFVFNPALYEAGDALSRGQSTDDLARKIATERPDPEDPKEFHQSHSSSLPPEVLKVLVAHRVLHPDGQAVMVSLERPEGRPLGRGPLMDTNVWQRLVAADTTEDHRWTEWIFDQAAGGEQAKENSRRALEQIHKRFVDERVNGFTHADTGKYHDAVNSQEAEERWVTRKPSPRNPKMFKPSPKQRFTRLLFFADQDQAEKLGCYGFYRAWPGSKDRNYEAIANAVSKFISLTPLAEKLNNLIEAGQGLGEKTVRFDPEHYNNVQEVEAANKRIERFFAAQKASKDVRVAEDKYVYSDNFVDVIVPLTYAAAVRYGWPEWAWANRENFEKMLMGRGTNTDHWQQHTKANIIAIMRFKQPMPGWVVRQRNEFKTPTLTNLAVFIPIVAMTSPGGISIQDDLTFWDEENRQNLTYDDIKKIIVSEPDRPENTDQDAILPIKSWKVYKSKDEAKDALAHFNKALEAITAWAHKFDSKKVKSDTLSL